MTIDFEKLRAPFPQSAIHWRAQTVTKDGNKAMALAYIDARDVMNRLDEVCGPENWQVEHYDCGGGKLGCRIGIRIGDQWVFKGDGAGDTQVEAEKGAFSSALKRAAVAWGIGRHLYDMPSPWVPCETLNGKFKKFTDDPWKYVKSPPAEKGREQGRDRGQEPKLASPAGQSEGADSAGRININVPERPDLIPVPKPENGQSMEQVWRAWATAYKTCLQMCADVADVNAWEKANEPPLQNLAKASPQAEQHVRDAANNVRGQLSQKPGEAA